MKNFISTGALLILGFAGYSQSFMDNAVPTTESSSVLISKSSNTIKSADCIGEWVSADGVHLALNINNKATWKDDGHIYYMHWSSEFTSDNGNIKINLLGNDRCKHKVFYLNRTNNGLEVVEDQTNLRFYANKELTATIQ